LKNGGGVDFGYPRYVKRRGKKVLPVEKGFQEDQERDPDGYVSSGLPRGVTKKQTLRGSLSKNLCMGVLKRERRGGACTYKGGYCS